MRIFLSYGHDQYAAFALRLKTDLEASHCEVWLDQDRIQTGDTWDQRIEDAIDRASSDLSQGRFILVMTPHSVRRPAGVCLKELARALTRNLTILPIMLVDVEPPLLICDKQWLDMRDCFPVDQHQSKYEAQFEILLDAIHHDRLDQTGVQSRLLHYLQPISHQAEMSRLIDGFIGRDWLLPKVGDWLARGTRVLWITAHPGFGKSAIAAWLSSRLREIVGVHFCRFSNSDRRDARKALLSLAYQLSTQIPDYQARLNALPLDSVTSEKNVHALFDRLFVDALTGLDAPPNSAVLLIDALDEAGIELPELIGASFGRAPAWLRLIVTSRPYETTVNFPLQALKPWMLSASQQDNIEDVRAYLEQELDRFGGTDSLKGAVNTILNKSEGLFLYAHLVLGELHAGRLSLANVNEFPQGLGGFYAQSFIRYFPDVQEYKSTWRRVFEVICGSREPLLLSDVSAVLGGGAYSGREIKTRFGSLLPVAGETILPFHKSLPDWLTRDEAGPYFIDVLEGHKELSRTGWQAFQANPARLAGYHLRHLPQHLWAAARYDDLRSLLLDFRWIRRKSRAEGILDLLSDYAHLRSEDSDAGAVHDCLHLSAHVIARAPDELPSQITGRLLGCRSVPIQSLLRDVAGTTEGVWLQPILSALSIPGGPLQFTFSQHAHSVTAVGITSDGARAISASQDAVILWDLDRGTVILTFPENRLVAHTPGTDEALLQAPDGSVALWNLTATPQSSPAICNARNPVALLSLHGNKHVVGVEEDGSIALYDLATGKQAQRLRGHTGAIQAIAVTAGGVVVSSGEDRTLRVWQAVEGRELRVMNAGDYLINQIALTRDGHLGATIAQSGALCVWNLDTGDRIGVNEVGASCLAVTPDGSHAVLGAGIGEVELWALEPHANGEFLGRHSEVVSTIAVTPDGKRAASAGMDHSVMVWAIGASSRRASAPLKLDDTDSFHLSADGQYGFCHRGRARLLECWNLDRSGEAVATVSNVRAAALIPGTRAMLCSVDDNLRIWEPDQPASRILDGKHGQVDLLSVSPEGRWGVSMSVGLLKVWDLQQERQPYELNLYHDLGWKKSDGWFPHAARVSPDGNFLVFGSKSGKVCLWDLAGQGKPRRKTSRGASISMLWLTPDLRQVICGTVRRSDSLGGRRDPGRLIVWDLESDKVRRTSIPSHGLTALTRDCRRVFTPHYSRKKQSETEAVHSIRSWDLESEEPLPSLTGHTNTVTGLRLADNDRLAVTASLDQCVRIWNVADATALAGFTADGQPVSCSVTPDGSTIAIRERSGGLHVLRLLPSA